MSVFNSAIVSGIEILDGSACRPRRTVSVPEREDNQVTLSWQAGTGAMRLHVYRGATVGTETLYQAGLASPSFVDTAAANGHSVLFRSSRP